MNKSLFKRPGAQQFTLVHRSQRDPLINDPEASSRVLKKVEPRGSRPSQSTDDAAGDDADREGEAGDAAAYGIYFDDTEYDYLQHLRTVGGQGDSYLVEAPPSAADVKGKGKKKAAFTMPDDVLPSHPLDEVSYTEATEIQAPEKGLRLDLDPRVREVLEALEDDAYAVDDGKGSDVEDQFWKEVVGNGEEVDEDFWGEEDDEVAELESSKAAGGQWGDVARFKASKPRDQSDDEDDEDDFGSEGGDTIAELRAASARRPARKPQSVAGSQFSMTSSAMFRNEGLRTLDDRFDEIEKMYEDSDDDDWGGGHAADDDDDEHFGMESHPEPRQDLDSIMDDFLSRFEVLGGKFRPALEGTDNTPAGKLDYIRRELAKLDVDDDEEGAEEEETDEGRMRRLRRKEKERIMKIVERQEQEEKRSKKERIAAPVEREKERWDCETVLSTYSNVSNHPRLLRVRDLEPSTRRKPIMIAIDDRTGFPTVNGEAVITGRKRPGDVVEEEEDVDMSDSDDGEDRPETIVRSRSETPAERKARKNAVKAERKERVREKKATKEAFGTEVKRQKKVAGKKVQGGGAADIAPGREGVRRLA